MEDDALLALLNDHRLTMAEIARRLHCSRSCVSNRYRSLLRENRLARRPDRVYAIGRAVPLEPPIIPPSPTPWKAPNMIETPPASPAPMPSALSLPRACCWPLWSHMARPDHRYCGKPRLELRPYCAEHCAQAYTGASKAAYAA